MRVPVLPTIIVAAAVATMISLGIWQLQRAQWKERLIRETAATGSQSRATLACALDGRPEVRAGRSREDEVGYRYLLPCRAGDSVLLDLGWSRRPDAVPRIELARDFSGVLAPAGGGSARVLVLDAPIPPLEPSAVPSAADLPNNHLLYAIQWFFFAAAAALIYILALRRRGRG